MVGLGRTGLLDGNSDNGANSAQVQINLPTRAELGKKKLFLLVCLSAKVAMAPISQDSFERLNLSQEEKNNKDCPHMFCRNFTN